MNELRDAITQLHLPQRGGATKEEKEKARQRRHSKYDSGERDHRPPLQVHVQNNLGNMSLKMTGTSL